MPRGGRKPRLTPTTEPAPTPPPEPAPAPSGSGLLTHRLPALANPVVWRPSGSMGGNKNPANIFHARGADLIVVPAGVVTRRLVVVGARHVHAIGIEVAINDAWTYGAADAEDDRGGLYFKNCTGDLFVEGVLIHGSRVVEGIQVGVDASFAQTPTLTIQNSRIVGLVGTEAGWHADAVQPWGGVSALRMDKVTIEVSFQALMFKADHNWYRNVDIRRTDLYGYGVQDGYLLNFPRGVNGDGYRYCDGPIRFGGDGTVDQRVYVTRPAASSGRNGQDFGQHDFGRVTTPTHTSADTTNRPTKGVEDGRGFLHWPTAASPAIHGRVWEGPNPNGDSCPDGVPGVGYVSPGYQEAA